MSTLFIDFETRSKIDLGLCGVDVYSKSISTDMLCMAFCFDDEPVQILKPNYRLSDRVWDHITNGFPVVGHNVNFEWSIWNNVCVPKYKWPELSITQCHDTMAMANAMGFPGGLEMAARAAGITQHKDSLGRRIMLMLSQPKRDGTFWQYHENPEKFEALYKYCAQDVEVERELYKRLMKLSSRERKLWVLDHKINSRGVGVDIASARKLDDLVKREQERLQIELQTITFNAVTSYNSHAAFKKWAASLGYSGIESIDKESVTKLLKDQKLPKVLRRALEIRQEAAKSSTAKLTAMLKGCTKGRARNTFEFYGAKQTARWAGRRLQLHNMPRAKLPFSAIEDVISRLDNENAQDEIRILYGSPMQAASDCLRSLLISAPGNRFFCADFSNIEGRALAWLAGEKWKLDAFRDFDNGKGKDLYILEYARAFKVKPETVTPDQRQIGKVITLAMGYQGGVGAFQNMAKAYGVKIPDEEADVLKRLWRAANPKIVQYWYDVQNAAREAIENYGRVTSVGVGPAKITFKHVGSSLQVKDPTGSIMHYPYPKLGKQLWIEIGGKQKNFTGESDRAVQDSALKYAKGLGETIKMFPETQDCITYKSYDSVTKQWGVTTTYGGSLVENLCQRISRQILADAMLRLEQANFPVVLHVHDEIVSEVKDDLGKFKLSEYERIMSEVPQWAEGFPIAAKGWTGYRYRKS